MTRQLLMTALFATAMHGSVVAMPNDASATTVGKAKHTSPSLTLVVDNYPPYIDEQMPAQGVLTELVVAAFQSQGISTQLQFKPWQHIRQAAAAPQHASFLWFKDKDLEQNWLFSAPIVQLRQLLITTEAQSFNPERLDQLREYRLGVTQGHFYGAQFEAQKSSFRLFPVVSDYQNLQQLLQGKVDYILMDPIVTHQLLQSFSQQTVKLRFLSKPVLTAKPAYLVCSRNYLPCHGMIQQFNHGLALQQQNGLERRLFGFGVTLLP
jgi:polar amino acid transport system substrate-binding protein